MMKRLLSSLGAWRPAVTLRRGALLYAILLAVALLYTQLLRSPASSLFFWFLLALPLFSLLYVLVARAAVKVYVSADPPKTEKDAPVTYELRIINEFIFPFPLVEAVLMLPQQDGVRCAERRMELSLFPLGAYRIAESVAFRYRGTYEIGVRELYVYDPMRLFCVRLDVDLLQPVLVLPRRLRMQSDSITSATDVPTDSARVVHGAERSEIGNIREYRSGDALKDVHWKLSAKTEELQIKQYNTNTARSVYILCDFARMPQAAPAEAAEDAPEKKQKAQRQIRLRSPRTLRERWEEWRARWAEKRFRRRRQRGMSETRAEDIAAFDELIRTTAQPNALQRFFLARKARRAEREAALAEAEAAKEAAAAEAAAAVAAEAGEPAEEDLSLGCTVRAEDADDMPEYCADGVAEMAVSAVLRELENGNACTLLWYDTREPGGLGAAALASPEDFEAVYPRFATTPPCPADRRVTELTLLVRESLNVTLRIATANIDPASLSEYGAVPSMFGGAGTGCVTEILLFNPEKRYESVARRREYVAMSRARLAHDGILLSEMRPAPSPDGTPRFERVL